MSPAVARLQESDPLRTAEFTANGPRVEAQESHAPAVGQIFRIKMTSPWTGPCPHCGRGRALKRKSRTGELPCTTHQRASGVEVVWFRAEVTAVLGDRMEYRSIERLSVVDPLPTTGGRSSVNGGMVNSYFAESIAAGRIVPEVM